MNERTMKRIGMLFVWICMSIALGEALEQFLVEPICGRKRLMELRRDSVVEARMRLDHVPRPRMRGGNHEARTAR